MKTIKHCNQWDWGVSILITAKQGRAAVTLSFENENPGVCFLSGLSVVPEIRRKGVATALMRECIKYCKQSRVIFRIDLSAKKEPFLLDFYKKFGFQEIKDDGPVVRMTKMMRP